MDTVVVHTNEYINRVQVQVRKSYVDILGYLSSPISNTMKKAVYIGDFSEESPSQIIEEKATPHFNDYWSDHKVRASNAKKLYMSKKCTLPRVFLRSEYSIVLDPEKSDYVVVPEDNSHDWKSYRCNIAVINENGDIALLDIDKGSTSKGSSLSSEDIERVKTEVEQYYKDAQFYYMDNMAPFKIYVRSKNQDYEDIVLGTYPNRQYVFEDLVEYDSPTKLNVESLQIMAKMENEQLEKMILGTNWREYPYTIYCLLEDACHLNCPHTASFSTVQKYVNNRFSYSADRENEFITPKDYNLLIKWIMKKLGLPEEGGLATMRNYNKIDTDLTKLVRRRVAIKPKYVDESNDTLIKIGDVVKSFSE